MRVGGAEIARHRDGISAADPFIVAMERLGLFNRKQAPAPDSFATRSELDKFNAKLQSTPGFLWLTSQGNSRVAQVEAGRTYLRVQLAATAQGLGMQPLSQALQEYPAMARPHADIHAAVGAKPGAQTVQMWVRLGHAAAEQAAPRRPIQVFVKA
jgi:hypothetical protein